MSKLRILIADDEPLARDRLRALLAPQASTREIVGEAVDGPDALALTERLRPDVLLLDIQMPGCDGLAVAARLHSDARPAVIFVTAHAEFAVGAYAVQAVDYLLKPFDRERLDAALARVDATHVARRAARLEQRIADCRSVASPTTRLVVPSNGRLIFVRTDEIVWVEAASNYVMLHLVERRRLMLRTSMAMIEQRLGTTQFIRIHRSAIARIAHIRELRPVGYGDYAVLLRSGESLPLSRHLRGQIQQFLT